MYFASRIRYFIGVEAPHFDSFFFFFLSTLNILMKQAWLHLKIKFIDFILNTRALLKLFTSIECCFYLIFQSVILRTSLIQVKFLCFIFCLFHFCRIFRVQFLHLILYHHHLHHNHNHKTSTNNNHHRRNNSLPIHQISFRIFYSDNISISSNRLCKQINCITPNSRSIIIFHNRIDSLNIPVRRTKH